MHNKTIIINKLQSVSDFKKAFVEKRKIKLTRGTRR